VPRRYRPLLRRAPRRAAKPRYDVQYDVDLAAYIDAVNPAFYKVPVRYHPEGDPVVNRCQAARLRQLFDYRAERRALRGEPLPPFLNGRGVSFFVPYPCMLPERLACISHTTE
jgi:hypothetical protein